jgi:sugar diacid utilization regulator
MKILPLLFAASSLMANTFACAETANAPSASTSTSQASSSAATAQPQLSDNPKMQAEGKRLAVLMEKLQKESDPEERRKIMSEAMCPQ